MLTLKGCPSLQDLEEMAKKCSEWTTEDRIRLAYLLILSGILFAGYKMTPLPRKYIELVRNIDRFERYPWGRAAFEFLIGSVHKAKKDLCNSSYSINGFIQVLQIWGYEAIPLIASTVKAHVEGDSHNSIMLKWKGGRTRIDFFGLNKNIKKNVVHHFIGNANVQSIFSPRWIDEIDDPLVSKLIGLILSNYNFDTDFWIGRGLQVGPSNQMKERSSCQVQKRKILKVQDEVFDETGDFVTREMFESCIEKLHKSIGDGFEGVITNIKRLDTKINELHKQVKIMQQRDN